MTLLSFLFDLGLFLVGVGALLWAYLAFSPMTRDLVVFLSRDQQITIFKYRRLYWALGILCLAVLLLRGLFSFAEPGGGGLLAAGGELLGRGHWMWLVLGSLAAAGIGLLYWALYVPVVMAPPRDHRMVEAAEADGFLAPDSVVLGIEFEGVARAYPRDLIARPHWFNDAFAGTPLMISYCILCNSGQAFVPVLRDGRRLDLRNMTAFDNNTIYHCRRTGNFIQQLDAQVIRGPDQGEVLTSYPVIMARWDEWKRLHPATKVFYAPPITLRDRFVQRMLMKMIPLSRLAARDEPWHLVRKEIDDRLPAMSFVFGVEIDGQHCAYPVAAMRETPVVNDQVGGVEVAVFYDPRPRHRRGLSAPPGRRPRPDFRAGGQLPRDRQFADQGPRERVDLDRQRPRHRWPARGSAADAGAALEPALLVQLGRLQARHADLSGRGIGCRGLTDR